MNLMQIKYFLSICQNGSVSRAAETLHVAQPSLSFAIKELESEFGVSLFKRQHSGMLLTTEGEMFKKMAESTLERANETEKIMKDMGVGRKNLRLGLPPMISSLILPKIYRDFLKNNTDIKLEITEGGRQELIEKLEEDYIDMIFLPHKQALPKKLISQKASSLEITCCVSDNNSLSKLQEIKPSQLSGKPVVLYEDGFFQTEEIKKWFATSAIKPEILFQTEQLSTMLSAITNDIAVGFMFKNLVAKNKELVSLPLNAPLYVDVSLVWKRDAYFFSGMKKFKEYLSKNNPFENTVS